MPAQPRKARDGSLLTYPKKTINRTKDSICTKVENKKQLQRKAKEGVLTITKTNERKYAGILCKIKRDTFLTELSCNFTRIRRTQKNDLLLELKAGEDVG